MPVVCSSGSGMLSECASIRVARFTIHGMIPAGEKVLGRESGRAAPSRDMVLKLAERLNVPLRERNVLLVAAGFAPAFPQRSLDDPALKSARAAIDLVLRAHEPNPALAYDRHWNLVSANRMVMPLLKDIPARLLGQPFNILRLAFHPEGLAPRTVNLAEWSSHLLERLHRH